MSPLLMPSHRLPLHLYLLVTASFPVFCRPLSLLVSLWLLPPSLLLLTSLDNSPRGEERR